MKTPIFTKAIRLALSDEEYRTLQTALMLRPEQGAVIPRSGGLRKIRWSGKGHGKRGGYRLIYFWERSSDSFHMLYIYPKNEQEDLTPKQTRLLGQVVREEFR